MKYTLFPLLITVLFCSGCRPLTSFNETSSAPELEWRPVIATFEMSSTSPELFPLPDDAPLSLPIMVDIALRNNPKTRMAWNEARAYSYNVGVAKSALYPRVDLSESIIVGNIVDDEDVLSIVSSNSSNFTSLQSNLSINYLLWDFGGRNASICAAKEALYSANWAHNQSIQNVILELVTSYYNYLEESELWNAAKANLKDAKENYDLALALFHSGIKTKADVLQSKANFVNAELQLITQEGRLEDQRGYLSFAMGYPATTKLNVEPLPSEINLNQVELDIDCLVQTAIDSRPDLAASYAKYLESQENICVVESERIPTLQQMPICIRKII